MFYGTDPTRGNMIHIEDLVHLVFEIKRNKRIYEEWLSPQKVSQRALGKRQTNEGAHQLVKKQKLTTRSARGAAMGNPSLRIAPWSTLESVRLVKAEARPEGLMPLGIWKEKRWRNQDNWDIRQLLKVYRSTDYRTRRLIRGQLRWRDHFNSSLNNRLLEKLRKNASKEKIPLSSAHILEIIYEIASERTIEELKAIALVSHKRLQSAVNYTIEKIQRRLEIAEAAPFHEIFWKNKFRRTNGNISWRARSGLVQRLEEQIFEKNPLLFRIEEMVNNSPGVSIEIDYRRSFSIVNEKNNIYRLILPARKNFLPARIIVDINLMSDELKIISTRLPKRPAKSFNRLKKVDKRKTVLEKAILEIKTAAEELKNGNYGNAERNYESAVDILAKISRADSVRKLLERRIKAGLQKIADAIGDDLEAGANGENGKKDTNPDDFFEKYLDDDKTVDGVLDETGVFEDAPEETYALVNLFMFILFLGMTERQHAKLFKDIQHGLYQTQKALGAQSLGGFVFLDLPFIFFITGRLEDSNSPMEEQPVDFRKMFLFGRASYMRRRIEGILNDLYRNGFDEEFFKDTLDVMGDVFGEVRSKILTLLYFTRQTGEFQRIFGEDEAAEADLVQTHYHLPWTLTWIDGIFHYYQSGENKPKQIIVHTHRIFYHAAPNHLSEITEAKRRLESYLNEVKLIFEKNGMAERRLGTIDKAILVFDVQWMDEARDYIESRKGGFGSHMEFHYINTSETDAIRDIGREEIIRNESQNDFNLLLPELAGHPGLSSIVEGLFYSRLVGLRLELEAIRQYAQFIARKLWLKDIKTPAISKRVKSSVLTAGRDVFVSGGSENGFYAAELDVLVAGFHGKGFIIEAKSSRVALPLRRIFKDKILKKLMVYRDYFDELQSVIKEYAGAKLDIDGVIFFMDLGEGNSHRGFIKDFLIKNESRISEAFGIPVKFVFTSSNMGEDATFLRALPEIDEWMQNARVGISSEKSTVDIVHELMQMAQEAEKALAAEEFIRREPVSFRRRVQVLSVSSVPIDSTMETEEVR
ncbi:MAG TPA: hypothetical protein VJA17_05330, partial [Candidatus Omnitrophota bacterium]|nr:hypothetical protein [Candidatus Omnitrophota bacterium]